MNERTLELAVEANDQTGNKFDLNYKELDSFLEKFAELIVKECLETIEEMDPHSAMRDIDDIYVTVEKHFGVEE